MRACAGSSPLARGTQVPLHSRADLTRFIPAYAGNSTIIEDISALSSVHPRLRGELWQRRYLAVVLCGSSPLTRGTRVVSEQPEYERRFIPAYAGNSIPGLVLHLENSVHPRLRGELNRMVIRFSTRVGSSPLTRGTRIPFLLRATFLRFIPAYAGNSLKDGINPSIHTLGI